jgi:hypothetical protein
MLLSPDMQKRADWLDQVYKKRGIKRRTGRLKMPGTLSIFVTGYGIYYRAPERQRIGP